MSTLQVNTISESTSASGVTIDGVLIKDGLVDGKDVSTLGTSSSDGGLQHIDTTTFSSVSSFTKSSVFSASYDVYRIFMTLSASDTANAQAWFQLSASGTALETNYVGKRVYDHLTNSSFVHHVTSTTNGFYIADPGGGLDEFFVGDIVLANPFATKKTVYKSDSTGNYATAYYRQRAYRYANNDISYDGYKVKFNSGTYTGKVSVYGLALS